MNENIDLTKILKGCPKGWELYSSIYGKVSFSRIEDDATYPIEFSPINKDGVLGCGSVTKEGIHNTSYNGECTLFPSENQRDWSKFSTPWYKNDKFNLKTLQSFDKILVRDNANGKWVCTLFSHTNNDTRFVCQASDSAYIYGIPYNDETKHLVGTTEEAPKYYRYWED